MKSFKQHLNDLEKRRKSIGYFPNVVHGSHADSRKINEETEDSHYDYDYDSHYQALENYGEDNPSHTELKEHHSYLSEHPNKGHVSIYTDSSKALNRALISGKELQNRHKELAEGIDKALKDAPPLHRDITVMSGLGFDPRQHMDENNILTNRAYTSTSTRGVIAHGFAAQLDDEGKPTNGLDGKTVNTHTLKINLPKGSNHGAYVEHISMTPGEDEFLLQRGLRYELDPNPEVIREDFGLGVNYSHHIWHVKRVY